MSYDGLKQIQTPTLDAMAAAGLRYNRFTTTSKPPRRPGDPCQLAGK